MHDLVRRPAGGHTGAHLKRPMRTTSVAEPRVELG